MLYTVECDLGAHGHCKGKRCDCWCHVKKGVEGQSAMVVAAEEDLQKKLNECDHIADDTTVKVVVNDSSLGRGLKIKQIVVKCVKCGREGVLCEYPCIADIEW